MLIPGASWLNNDKNKTRVLVCLWDLYFIFSAASIKK
jgi:hypothetical protein